MALNFDSLSRSIDSLGRALAAAEKNMHLFDDDTQETLRAGVIQNFEVAYEQCWKMLQRWIKANRTPKDADNPRTRKDLFRMAARYGLIADPLSWFTYGEARSLTSQVYDAEKALSIYATAISFHADAKYVLNQPEQLND